MPVVIFKAFSGMPSVSLLRWSVMELFMLINTPFEMSVGLCLYFQFGRSLLYCLGLQRTEQVPGGLIASLPAFGSKEAL